VPIEKLALHRPLEDWHPHLTDDPLPPRRRVLTPIQELQAQEQVKTWADQKVIEPIKTPPLLNNLVLVSKKDGRIRVCVDCTPANKVTSDFDWPLPRLQDIRYRTKGATWFARLDLKDAFFRINVPAKFRALTAFMVGKQAYQFRKMPFGLKTAPSTFQRFMDWGLSAFLEWATWYIDDILICAETLPQLRTRERMVRRALARMGCEINEKKSETEKRQLIFAGIHIFGEGVGPNVEKLAELNALAPPSTKEDAQSALGLVSYLRDFIPLTAHFTSQLYPDKQGLRLPPDQYVSEWQRLARHIRVAATTTHHWKDGVDADLYTDASGYGVGAIVIQSGKVVALASRKLTPAECRYSATDREHLGLVFAAQKFKLLLHQRNAQTRVWTDHAPLTTRRYDDLTPRQARWQTYVANWMPNIVHVRGKDNPADFISRWKIGDVGANF
jgi:hypothetical protein